MKSEREEDKYAFIKEQLKWLDLDDDFDLDNDLSLRRIKRSKEKLFRFLENNVDCFMDKIQQKEFSNKLMKLFIEAKYVESSCTSCGKNKINKTFKECELPFEIVSKKGQRKGEQSLWILRKREVEYGFILVETTFSAGVYLSKVAIKYNPYLKNARLAI